MMTHEGDTPGLNGLPVTSGVPQGFVLGPLLFLIYINDLDLLPLTQGTSLLLFADDILMSKAICSHPDIADFQHDIDLVSYWAKANHLTLNSDKSKFMLISHSQTQSCPSFYLNGIELERVQQYKYLGVWISDNLSWEKHVEYICSKARRHLGYLFQTLSPHCTPQALIYFYRAQVLPIFDYGSILWDPHLNKQKLMLEKIQLFATRMAAKEWHSQPETLNAQFNLSSLRARRHYLKYALFF